MPKCTKGKRRALAQDEQERFLKACWDDPFGPYFAAMLACGFRPAETMALEKAYVFKDTQMIRICQSVENHSTDIKDPKTAAGFRDVPFPDWYVPFLDRALSSEKGKGSTFVFTNSRGNMMSATSTKKNWVRIAENAKLNSDITPYYLRHTYATSLAEKGIDMKTAQYLLGHATIAMTAEIYTHVSKKMMADTKTKINAAAIL